MTAPHDAQATVRASEPRYGNWRRPRTAGLFGLSTSLTAGLLGWVVFAVTMMLIQPLIGWILFGIGAAAVAPMAKRDRHGRTLYSAAVARTAYRRGRRRGQHLHQAGPLGVVPGGTHKLPGLLAPSSLHHARDSFGRDFALISHANTGHYSAVFACDPEGAGLVDRDTVDQWVAGWADWLGRLGQLPNIVGAQVVVETCPDSGQRLTREVTRLTSGDGPDLAKQILAETAEHYPDASDRVSTRVAVTWNAATPQGSQRSVEDMAVEIGSRLPALGQDLAHTGAGAARPMTVAQLAESVHAAYNPELAGELDRARDEPLGTGITWDNAGPSGVAVEHRDRYLHGGGCSISASMEQAPRGAVLSSVLRDVLAPHPDFDRKRVLLTYRPHDPGHGAQLVEADLNHARTLASKRKVAAARDDADVRAAQQATDEEASGAGVLSFGLVVTVTTLDPQRLQQADATLNNAAAASRIRLRRVYGAQAATFALGLGIGLQPQVLATLGGIFEGE